MPSQALSLAETQATLQNFRTFTELSKDAMFLLEQSSMAFIDANPSACNMLGLEREEFIEKQLTVPAGKFRDKFKRSYGAALDGNVASIPLEILARGKDSTQISLAIQRCARVANIGWIVVATPGMIPQTQMDNAPALHAGEDLARLSIELQAAQEEERKNIATRLHGDIGQLLAALRINLTLLQQQFSDAADCSRALASMDKLVVSSISSLRKISAELRPKGLDDGGLYNALQTLQQQCVERHGIICELTAREEDLVLEETGSTMLFRIVQDALTNVFPHTEVKTLAVVLERERNTMRISMHGKTLNSSPAQKDYPSYRLAGMRERVKIMRGKMEVVDISGHEPKIDISFPLSDA